MSSVYASRLFERNLRALLGVSFVSVTSVGYRHFRLEGLDLCPVSSSGFSCSLRFPSAFGFLLT